MTTLEHDAGAAGDTPVPASRRGPITLVGGLIAIVVVVTSWWAWTVYVTSGIEVSWTEEPDCAGTRLSADGRGIVTSETMSCIVNVTVRNTGPVAVSLHRAVLPYLGPGGGSVVRAVAIDDRQPTGNSLTDIHAVVELDHEIASGESWTFRLRLGFRADGCTAAGEMSIADWPTVTTTYLGRDIDVAADQRLVFVTRRQNPGCSP